MSLAKLARFSVLRARADSAAQTISRYALEINPAEYSFEIFYPSLVLELYRLQGVRSNGDPASLLDYDLMKSTYDGMRTLHVPFSLSLDFRSRLSRFYPTRIRVPIEKCGFALFLSFHQFDYRHDNDDSNVSGNVSGNEGNIIETLVDSVQSHPAILDTDRADSSSDSFDPLYD